MAKEKGIAIINARNEVNKVPIRKGKAPYTLLTGSHVLPHKYLKPNDFKDGIDSMINVSMIPSTNITITNAIVIKVRLNNDSIRICW